MTFAGSHLQSPCHFQLKFTREMALLNPRMLKVLRVKMF